MSRGKKPLLPYLSTLDNCMDKRFIQVGNSLLLSKKFQELSVRERYTYLCMAMEAGGRIEFKFPKRAFAKYGIPVATARRAIETLDEKKFIERTSLQNLRKANEYKFINDWKQG